METQELSPNVIKITAKQIRAAQLLAEGFLLKDIAKTLKVRAETISRWRRRAAFRAEHQKQIEENKINFVKAREEMRANLQHEITHLMNEAIDTINDQLNHHYDKQSDRAKLAFDVLKFLKADQLFAPAARQPEKSI